MKVRGDQGDLSSAFQFSQPNITESHPSKEPSRGTIFSKFIFNSCTSTAHICAIWRGFRLRPAASARLWGEFQCGGNQHIHTQRWQRFIKIPMTFTSITCQEIVHGTKLSVMTVYDCVVAVELTPGRCKMVIGSNLA